MGNTPPIFRQEIPREVGLYWFKLLPESGMHYCRVWRQQWAGGRLVTNAGEGQVTLVSRLSHRWWAGPLLEPKKEKGTKKEKKRG